MSNSEQEIEAKFFIRSLDGIAARLQAAGAELAHARVFEKNLRFDTADGRLTRDHQVLRLRQDSGSVMTFKGPSAAGASVSVRTEIEFQVSDFQAAQHLLEALGYVISIVYEKYRTTYLWNGLMITLDEMPFGFFVEIEGPDAEHIEQAARALNLNWNERSSASYLALFNRLKMVRKLSANHLTFAELQGVQALPQDLGFGYADDPLKE